MNLRRTARRTTAAALLAVGLGAGSLVLPGSAAARAPEGTAARSAIVDCIPGLDGTSPPQSMTPGEVAGAFFDPSSAKPPAAAPDAQVSAVPPNTLATYGWSGFTWPDYDPGCSATISLDDRLTGTLARASLATLVWANAATTGASRYAYDPATYDPVDTLAGSLDSGIGGGFARPGFWIVALMLGAALVWTADRRSPRHHAQAATLVLALGLSVITVSTWNATLGPTVDRAVLTVVSWANTAATPGVSPSTDAGQQIGESLRSNIVVRTWRSGTFGPNTSTADRYADPLFAAGAITAAEGTAAGRDSDALGKLADEDKKRYEQLAGQVKNDDPRAYDYLAGKHNGARLFYATLGWLTWLWAASFQTVAAFATAYALTLVRIVLGLWSAIALVALFRPRYAMRAIGMLVGALVAGVGLSVVAAGARLAYGQLLSSASALNTWVTVGVGLVVCAATWAISWPLFRVLPGTPERLRRIGRGSRADDVVVEDGTPEPGPTSAIGASGSGALGGAEPGVPAEASPGRPAGVLVAAAEGLPGRRRPRAALGAGPTAGDPAGPGAPAGPAGPSGTTTTAETTGAGGTPRTVALPGGATAGGTRGDGRPAAATPAQTRAAAAAQMVTSAGDARSGAAPASAAAAAQVGAEARPSARQPAPALGAEAAPAPGRVVASAVPRPPRKVLQPLYPVYSARRETPSDPDLLRRDGERP